VYTKLSKIILYIKYQLILNMVA